MIVLIVIAHPDDEVLGMGGTICKHIDNGDMVNIVVVTEPNMNYSMEYKADKIRAQSKVDEFLDIEHRYCMDFLTVSLNKYSYGKLNQKIQDYVDIVEPNIIYTHFKGDINRDHRIVYEACLVATRPPKQIKLVCFETLSETEWGDEAFKPNYYVNIFGYLGKKTKAFGMYKSEIKPLLHPRNATGISNLSLKRGLESGCQSAEAFRIVRWYG